MIKYFCDHCGKEIDCENETCFEMDERDFPDNEYSNVRRFFGKELCEVCYSKRLQRHSDVDEAFFHMVKEG